MSVHNKLWWVTIYYWNIELSVTLHYKSFRFFEGILQNCSEFRTSLILVQVFKISLSCFVVSFIQLLLFVGVGLFCSFNDYITINSNGLSSWVGCCAVNSFPSLRQLGWFMYFTKTLSRCFKSLSTLQTVSAFSPPKDLLIKTLEVWRRRTTRPIPLNIMYFAFDLDKMLQAFYKNSQCKVMMCTLIPLIV